MKVKDIHAYSKVWFVQPWTDRIVYGRVVDLFKEPCHNLSYVRLEGNKRDDINSFLGTQYMAVESCYETREDCYRAYKEKTRSLIKAYKQKINSIEDLVRFTLECPFGSNEYTDYEAIQAYKERSAELGFDLGDEKLDSVCKQVER